MRNRWICVMAVSGVICLTLGGSPASAQEAEHTAEMVTGSQDCEFRTGLCEFTASDPRVTGTGIVVKERVVLTAERTPVVAWDEVTLEGPDGTWSGHHYAVADESGTAHVFMLLSGRGAYEGWHYMAAGTDLGPHGDHDLIGVLYEGPLPEFGPVVPDDRE